MALKLMECTHVYWFLMCTHVWTLKKRLRMNRFFHFHLLCREKMKGSLSCLRGEPLLSPQKQSWSLEALAALSTISHCRFNYRRNKQRGHVWWRWISDVALRLSAMKLHLKELVEMSGELHRPTDFSHGFKRKKSGSFLGLMSSILHP